MGEPGRPPASPSRQFLSTSHSLVPVEEKRDVWRHGVISPCTAISSLSTTVTLTSSGGNAIPPFLVAYLGTQYCVSTPNAELVVVQDSSCPFVAVSAVGPATVWPAFDPPKIGPTPA